MHQRSSSSASLSLSASASRKLALSAATGSQYANAQSSNCLPRPLSSMRHTQRLLVAFVAIAFLLFTFLGHNTDRTKHQRASQSRRDSSGDGSLAQSPFLKEPSSIDAFSSYHCLGEELQAYGGLYNRPFKFHVYRNMPAELLGDIIEKTASWWKKDDAANQFITEVQIYKYLHLHPCHTDNPNEADAFVVPAQTVSAVWLSRGGANGKHKDEGASYFRNVTNWVKEQRTGRRFSGRDHYVVSVPWWMGGRPYPGYLNLIGVEVPVSFHEPKHFGDTLYLRATNDIVIPYPDPDAMEHYTPETLANVTKEYLAVFVGQNRAVAPVRDVVKKQFQAYNKRKGKKLAIWNELRNRDDIQSVTGSLPRATFGPVMPGDSYSSRRLFSLLFAGTIPVIICDYCMLPYQDVLDYTKFAIFLPEEHIRTSGDFDIFTVLESVTPQEIASLQEYGRQAKRHFTYHEGTPQPGDAFDLLVREMALTHYRNRGLKSMWMRAYGEDTVDGKPVTQGFDTFLAHQDYIPKGIDGSSTDEDTENVDTPAKEKFVIKRKS